MLKKLLSSQFNFKSLLKSTIFVTMLLVCHLSQGQATTMTRLYSDFGGYWTSNNTSGSPAPNDRHNLIGFTFSGTTFSTGVNDGLMNTNAPGFTSGNFRSFPYGVMPGTVSGTYLLLTGNLVDGSASSAVVANVSTITTKDALTDGIRGLDMGTAITNISSTVTLKIPVGNFSIAAINDNAPDIIIPNVGTESSADTYVFLAADGTTVVGVSKTLNFGTLSTLGTCKLDLFNYPSSQAVATAVPFSNYANGDTRPIKMGGFKLSDFGITAGNVDQIAFLKITPGGGNDPAFIAYNADSFTPRTKWLGTVSTAWNNPLNWSPEFVPTADTDAVIPSTVNKPIISGAMTVKSLYIETGAKLTVTGTLDVKGDVSNIGTLDAASGTVTFTGAKAQIVTTDISGTTTFKNLTANNTAGVSLSGVSTVTGTLNLIAGQFTTGNFLTLKSNATTTAVITPVAGTVSGTMTIERYIPAKRAFRFLSSPTDGGTIRSNWMENGVDVAGLGTDITGAGGASNGFDISGSNNPSLFTYLNNNPGPGANWNAVTSANISQVAGVPYRMLVRGDRLVDQTNNNATATATTLRTKGTIKYGNVSVSDLNPVADGFNLIGNPYQSPVNMYTLLNDASTTGIKKTFYTIWDPNVNTRGGYVTVTFAPLEVNDIVSVQDNTSPTNTGASRYLQPGQAAFVQTQVAGAPSLIFKENQKALSFSNVFRQANDGQSKIRFTLYTANALANGNSAADGFVVTFDESDENAANEFDAIKAVNQDESLGMMNSDKIYSFQRMAMPIISDVIPLSSVQYRTTDYTFRVAVEGLTDVMPMLLDKYTQTTTELTNDNVTDVNFTVNPAIAATTDANRFDIIFQETALGNTENAFGNTIRLYPNPSATGNFFVALPSQFAGQASIEIVSLLGQKVFTQTINATSNVLDIQPTSQLQAGVYFVNVTTAQGKATKKLIIK